MLPVNPVKHLKTNISVRIRFGGNTSQPTCRSGSSSYYSKISSCLYVDDIASQITFFHGKMLVTIKKHCEQHRSV